MKLDKLGNYVHLVDVKNNDLTYKNVLGININKEFMSSVANLSNTDLSKYKVIKKGQFAYSSMQVGRDETIRIALYNDNEPAIISPAYQVIEVNDSNEILPEFIMMWFLRPESDRYGWFISDGSVRASLDFNSLCEILIPIIPLEEQQQIVSLYNALLKNQAAYQNSLDDLQLICDSYIENLIKTEPKKRLGEYIEQVDNRNTDLKIDNLLGISVNKVFIPTKSNKEQLNLSNYKIVSNKEFSFVSVTSRNGEKISVALLEGKSGLVSSTYIVFKINATDKLLPEFLYLWFSRPEFDRYVRFHSWGSARETFGWEDMCDVMLPIPSIEKQQVIVTIYHTLETRKKLNEKLKESLQPLCPILMKGVREKVNRLVMLEAK